MTERIQHEDVPLNKNINLNLDTALPTGTLLRGQERQERKDCTRIVIFHECDIVKPAATLGESLRTPFRVP